MTQNFGTATGPDVQAGILEVFVNKGITVLRRDPYTGYVQGVK